MSSHTPPPVIRNPYIGVRLSGFLILAAIAKRRFQHFETLVDFLILRFSYLYCVVMNSLDRYAVPYYWFVWVGLVVVGICFGLILCVLVVCVFCYPRPLKCVVA